MNWANEDHFEQCFASVRLVPRATHLATAKELATRWNFEVDEMDRDFAWCAIVANCGCVFFTL